MCGTDEIENRENCLRSEFKLKIGKPNFGGFE